MMKKKILVPLSMSLFLIASCGEDQEKGTKTHDKEGETLNKKEERTEKSEGEKAKAPELEWEELLDITRDVYKDTDFDEIEKEPVKVPLSWDHKPPILSSEQSPEAKSYYRFVSFEALEFAQPGQAAASYRWFRRTADLWNGGGFEKDEERTRFLNAFRKGGSSYVLVGRFLLHHTLRCNMEEEDYEKDAQWMERLAALHPNGSSFRMECGYRLRD